MSNPFSVFSNKVSVSSIKNKNNDNDNNKKHNNDNELNTYYTNTNKKLKSNHNLNRNHNLNHNHNLNLNRNHNLNHNHNSNPNPNTNTNINTSNTNINTSDNDSDNSIIDINNNDINTAFGLTNTNRIITHKQHNTNKFLKNLYITTFGLLLISIIGFSFTLKSYFILDDILNNNTTGIYDNYIISNNIYGIDINFIYIYVLIILLCYAIYITFNTFIYIFYMTFSICLPYKPNYTRLIMFNNYVFSAFSLFRLSAVCALITYNIKDTPFLQVNITNIEHITNNEIININSCSYYNYLLLEIIVCIIILSNSFINYIEY